MYRFCLLPIFLLISQLVLAQQDDDFWLLVDDPFHRASVIFNGGGDSDSGVYYGLETYFSITDRLNASFGSNRQEFEDTDSTDDWFIAVDHRLTAYLDWQLSYEWWGVSDVLETADTQIKLYLYGDAWNGILGPEIGDVTLFTNPFIQQTAGISSGDIDHEAYIVGLGYNASNAFFELTYTKHDYGVDLSLLPYVPRLWFIFKPETLMQSTALTDEEIELVLGLVKKENSVELSYSALESAVTGETSRYLGLLLNKQLSAELALGFEMDMPLDDGPVSAGVLMTYSW